MFFFSHRAVIETHPLSPPKNATTGHFLWRACGSRETTLSEQHVSFSPNQSPNSEQGERQQWWRGSIIQCCKSPEGKTEASSYPSQREGWGGPRREGREEMPRKSRVRKNWPAAIKLGKDLPLERKTEAPTWRRMLIGQLWLYMAGHFARKLLKRWKMLCNLIEV